MSLSIGRSNDIHLPPPVPRLPEPLPGTLHRTAHDTNCCPADVGDGAGVSASNDAGEIRDPVVTPNLNGLQATPGFNNVGSTFPVNGIAPGGITESARPHPLQAPLDQLLAQLLQSKSVVLDQQLQTYGQELLAQVSLEALQPQQPPPLSFDEAAEKLADFMQARGDQNLSFEDLQNLASGTGNLSGTDQPAASVDPEVRRAAAAMLRDGGAEYREKIGGEDGLSSRNDMMAYSALHGSISDQRAAAIATLQRHRDKFPDGKLSAEDRERLIQEETTPPDLKEALQQIQSDPGLLRKLDMDRDGGFDQEIGLRNLDAVSTHPDVIAHNRRMAQAYADNYVPSDADLNDPETCRPHPITEDEAMSELYRYSESLPGGDVTRESLQKLVDGTAGGDKKAPPALIAAAQYYLDRPEAWDRLTAGRTEENGAIHNDQLQQAISEKVNPTALQRAVLDSVERHADVFFKDTGTFNREKLVQLVQDPNQSLEVRNTAQILLRDKMLYGMLDNGVTGHLTSTEHTTDDDCIALQDLQAFRSKSTRLQEPPPIKPLPMPLLTSAAKAAAKDMIYGTVDQPDIKQPRHEKTLGEKIRDGVLDALKWIGKIGAIVGGVVLAFVNPVLGAAVAIGGSIMSGLAGFGKDVANGKDPGKAAADMGIGIATDVVAAAVPAAGQVIGATAGTALKTALPAIRSGVEAAETGAKAGAAVTAEAAQAGVKAGTTVAAEAAEAGAQGGIKGLANRALDYVKATPEKAYDYLRSGDAVADIAKGGLNYANDSAAAAARQALHPEEQRSSEGGLLGTLASSAFGLGAGTVVGKAAEAALQPVSKRLIKDAADTVDDARVFAWKPINEIDWGDATGKVLPTAGNLVAKEAAQPLIAQGKQAIEDGFAPDAASPANDRV